MNPDTTPTPKTDCQTYIPTEHGNLYACPSGMWVPDNFARQLERELAEKTNEVARLRKLMREYIDFVDENLGTTADWPMEAAFDNETTAQRHCDLLNAMKREVKPEDIN